MSAHPHSFEIDALSIQKANRLERAKARAMGWPIPPIDDGGNPDLFVHEKPLSRTDRAYLIWLCARERLAAAQPDTLESHEAAINERSTCRAYSAELERDMTDAGREQNEIDAHRKTEAGRAERNKSRRQREKANHILPGDVKEAMTPKDRAEYEKACSSDTSRASRLRKKEWTETRIEADRQERMHKRGHTTEQLREKYGLWGNH